MADGSLPVASESFRPYRPGDEVAINRTFNQLFGLERSLEEWAWKFPEGEGRRFILLAEDDRGVAAHFAAIPVPVVLDGRRLLVGQVVDVYSRSRRGIARRNLFVRLVHAFYERFCGPGGLALVYGFPGRRHFRLGVLELGYSAPRPVGYLVRRGEPPRCGLGLAPSRRLRTGLEPEAADRLWRRAARRYPAAVVRDGAWLGRRFAARPGVRYLHRRIDGPDGPEALGVLRHEGGELSWAELVWDGRDPRALRLLDDEVARLARATGATASRLWLDGDLEARRLLGERGWVPAEEPQGLHIGAVSFHGRIDAADFCRSLYVTMGDADLV